MAKLIRDRSTAENDLWWSEVSRAAKSAPKLTYEKELASMTNADELIEKAERLIAAMERDGWKLLPFRDLAAALREARRDLERLEAGIAAVVNLHSPNHDPDGWQYCNVCRDDYRCQTIRVLDAAMGGESTSASPRTPGTD